MEREITLTGENIRLEPLLESHAKGLFEAGKDPAIWQWLPRNPFTSVDDVKSWIEDAQKEHSTIPFVTILSGSNQVVGSTRYLRMDPQNRATEIGYTWVNPKYWKTRVNTECKLLLLKNAFEDWGFFRVQFRTDVLNQRSQDAIKRLGAVEEGRFRSEMLLPDGRRRDSVYFSIIKEEWPEVKARLESKLEFPKN